MLIHVAARDLLGTRGHTNLVALPIVANHLTHGEGSVVLRIDRRRGLVDGGVMPAVTVVGVISRRNYSSKPEVHKLRETSEVRTLVHTLIMITATAKFRLYDPLGALCGV